MRVRIESDGADATRVWVNGRAISGVLSAEVALGVGEPTEVTLVLLASEVTVDLDVEPAHLDADLDLGTLPDALPNTIPLFGARP